ncbi:MAG: GIY-YIG nuclease family protein [Candidatus Babeliales bacterium]|jgi:predicted GIY-YIG superfamily endonuclease
MYYVYLLRSINFPDKKYIGFTDNFSERLLTHNSGNSPHTKLHKPWKTELLIGFDDKMKAAAFEKYLKSGAGRAFAKKRFW